ncbi:MAG TPA: hypothetical protein VFX60_18910 [Micromonospora sp.]|nr:hypothetical protein [Micromonospora sp.]
MTHDRIGAAVTRAVDGRAVAMEYEQDFHDRLGEWLRFWWANSPGHWVNPLEIVGEVQPGGQVFVLSGIRYTHRDRLHDAFAAESRQTAAYWATVASLHHFFPVVRIDPSSGRVRIEAGHAGFTASVDQINFVRAACQVVWGDATAPKDWRARSAQIISRGDSGGLTTRIGWSAFTRATVRRGLGTDI